MWKYSFCVHDFLILPGFIDFTSEEVLNSLFSPPKHDVPRESTSAVGVKITEKSSCMSHLVLFEKQGFIHLY
ncbi:hypothetical protein GN956_G25933 [Arapaima gigas]